MRAMVLERLRTPLVALERPRPPHVARYPLDGANRALDDLRAGRFDGTAVLAIR